MSSFENTITSTTASQANGRNLCRFHGSAGGCRYGNYCNYSHSNPQSVPFCKNMASFNTCRYGNNCRYRHQQFSQSNNYSTINYTGPHQPSIDMYTIPLRSNQWINSQNANRHGHLLIKSSTIIEIRYGQKLLELIKPLQNRKDNYTHSKLINMYGYGCNPPLHLLYSQLHLLQQHLQQLAAQLQPGLQPTIPYIQQQIDELHSLLNSNRPKLQELICSLQHFRQYKQLKTLMRNHGILNAGYKYQEIAMNNPEFDSTDNMMPMSLCPAIFSLRNMNFLTEINGLLYRDNVELYEVIAKIFIKMIPMFEQLLNIKLCTSHEQLSVIVKMQDYQFHNECNIVTEWYTEAGDKDNIIAGGLYYFDINSSDGLKFTTNAFEINEEAQHHDVAHRVNIKKNDCIVFRTTQNIMHRAVMITKNADENKDTNKYITKKILGFFILNPTINHNVNDFKWINFPLKLELFIKYFLGYDMELYYSIPIDILILLKIFTFGDDEYLNKQRTTLQENLQAAPQLTAHRLGARQLAALQLAAQGRQLAHQQQLAAQQLAAQMYQQLSPHQRQ